VGGGGGGAAWRRGKQHQTGGQCSAARARARAGCFGHADAHLRALARSTAAPPPRPAGRTSPPRPAFARAGLLAAPMRTHRRGPERCNCSWRWDGGAAGDAGRLGRRGRCGRRALGRREAARAAGGRGAPEPVRAAIWAVRGALTGVRWVAPLAEPASCKPLFVCEPPPSCAAAAAAGMQQRCRGSQSLRHRLVLAHIANRPLRCAPARRTRAMAMRLLARSHTLTHARFSRAAWTTSAWTTRRPVCATMRRPCCACWRR
jgi:hypothetical protein